MNSKNAMKQFHASYQAYTLRFKKPAGTSRGALHTKETFFLKLADPDDPTCFGLGECAPLTGLSVDGGAGFEDKLAEVCQQLNEGLSPVDLDLAGYPALAFGLEMALLDWFGGGQRRLFAASFFTGDQAIPTHGLIWMGDRADMLGQVRRKVEQGFTCIKMKIGTLEFAEECALLTDIRREFSADKIELRLDANGAFTLENVLVRLQRLAEFEIAALEQPLKPGQWEAMAALCADSPIPLALDEELIDISTSTEKYTLLQTIRPHYLVLKPSLIGGFQSAEEWITLAEHAGVGWWVNSMLESNVGLNALCQWVSTLKPTLTQAMGTGQLFENNIPSPLQLKGTTLIYDQALAWDFSQINDIDNL